MAKRHKKQAQIISSDELVDLAVRATSANAGQRWAAVEDAWKLAANSKSRRVKAIGRLIARAMITDPCAGARVDAVDALGELGTASDQRALKAALSDEDPTVRAVAVSNYADLAGRKAISAARDALQDGDEVVRKYAAVALYDIMGPAAEEEIRSRLPIEPDTNARIGMLFVLADLGDKSATAELRKLRSHASARIRSAANNALADLSGRKSGA